MLVYHNCSFSTTTVTGFTPAPIVIAAFDPETLVSYSNFTDSASDRDGYPNLCYKTYSANVSTNAGGFHLTSFSINETTSQFKVSS